MPEQKYLARAQEVKQLVHDCLINQAEENDAPLKAFAKLIGYIANPHDIERWMMAETAIALAFENSCEYSDAMYAFAGLSDAVEVDDANSN